MTVRLHLIPTLRMSGVIPPIHYAFRAWRLIRHRDFSFLPSPGIHCPTYRVSRGDVPDFERMFLTLKYTDITQNTFVYPKLNGYRDNGERSLKV